MRTNYIFYIKEQNTNGSNKASSYIRAIDLLEIIFQKHPVLFAKYGNIWSINSVQLVSELYDYVIEQQRLFKKGQGLFIGETPVSYWKNHYCSAALKSYKEFLIINGYEDRLWSIVEKSKTSPESISSLIESTKIDSIQDLVVDQNIDFTTKEGKETLRSVKTRVNQGFFRKMILRTYNGQCCITGLNVPEVLRASHIVAWADDEKNRMNPANGLCLSATYDAAFDRHLISFDKDYRMILSPNLKDYTTNKAFKEHFVKFEGVQMNLPNSFLPDKSLLEKHRNAFSK